MVFTSAQQVTKHLVFFCNKICCLEIPKIAESGHTAYSAHAVVGGDRQQVATNLCLTFARKATARTTKVQ